MVKVYLSSLGCHRERLCPSKVLDSQPQAENEAEELVPGSLLFFSRFVLHHTTKSSFFMGMKSEADFLKNVLCLPYIWNALFYLSSSMEGRF